MVDLDKAFEQYIVAWFKAHNSDYANETEMEDDIPKIYIRWADLPCKELSGKSPNAYFDEFTPKQLIDMLVESCSGKNSPSSLLLDKIGENVAAGEYLVDAIKSSKNVEFMMMAVNLLTEMGAAHPLDLYVDWLTDAKVNNDLRELGVEVLTEHSAAVASRLFALIEGANNSLLTLIAEILINAPKDERTYSLLLKLFALGDNIPLYASYIGKYGDERASSTLYRALDTCNYMEYIEVKNAIERMGGVVDLDRDFSEDIYYKAIKNLE